MKKLLFALLAAVVACSPQESPAPAAREVGPVDTTVRRTHRLLFPSAVLDSLTAGLPVVVVPTDSFTTGDPYRREYGPGDRPPFWEVLSGSFPRYTALPYRGHTTLVRDLVAGRLFAWDNVGQRVSREWADGMRPGEFRTVGDVATNDSLIAVSDYRNNRIQILGPDFEVVRMLPLNGRTGMGSMALTGEGLFSFVEAGPDSAATWKLVKQEFDWSLPDTMPNPVFANPYPARGIGTWPRMASSKDYMAFYFPSSPYVMVCDAEGRLFGMVAFEGDDIEQAMATYRKSLREDTPVQLADGREITRVVYPFFVSNIQIDPQGWLSIFEEGRTLTKVDLKSLGSSGPVWRRTPLVATQ